MNDSSMNDVILIVVLLIPCIDAHKLPRGEFEVLFCLWIIVDTLKSCLSFLKDSSNSS